jgi:hypothetical protein
MRDRNDAASRFNAADLVFGLYDLSGTSPSGRILAPSSKFYIDAYLRRVSKAKRIASLRVAVVRRSAWMPPACFHFGTLDAFFEDNLAMAMRWLRRATLAELAVYPSRPTRSRCFPPQWPMPRNRRELDWLAARLST